jgi:hypothetical protein
MESLRKAFYQALISLFALIYFLKPLVKAEGFEKLFR